MPTRPKDLVDYIEDAPTSWASSLEDYHKTPAIAFLNECVQSTDAIGLCRRRFKRKNDGNLAKNSQDSLYRLGGAAFSSMMSHFEMYQRFLFAGMLEASRFDPNFRLAECVKYLERDSNMALNIERLLAYRGRPAPIGQLIADSVGSWHNPERVISHFKALVPDYVFFSGKESTLLRTLWQLRHSIVHTGGWLTHADAQKVLSLVLVGDRPILLDERFVEAVARRLHGIIKRSTSGIGAKFETKLAPAILAADRAAVITLFTVRSPRPAWLATPV